MRGGPTERQAALAARQLDYHRGRLRWMERRARDNGDLLLLYLTLLDAATAVLPGGYRVSRAPDGSGGITVEKLAPATRYEQLVLHAGGREIS